MPTALQFAMATELEPIIGNWYTHLDKGQPFVVIGVDDAQETVEIQHFDGDLEELELRAWFDMELEPAEPPEDWTGPVDDVETDDVDYTETDMSPEDWTEPLRESHAASEENWESVERENERDEWGEGEIVEEIRDDEAFPGGESPDEALEPPRREDEI